HERRGLAREVHDLFALDRAADVELHLVPRRLRDVGVERFRRHTHCGRRDGRRGHSSPSFTRTCLTTSSIVVTLACTSWTASYCSVCRPCWIASSRASRGVLP